MCEEVEKCPNCTSCDIVEEVDEDGTYYECQSCGFDFEQ